MYEKIMLWPKPVPGDFQPYLEIFTLDEATAKEGGMIVICPGGGYHFRSERESANIAECFNRLGWHAAVLQYRVAPAVFPAPQQDALRALKIIRASAARLGVKTDNLAIAGFSAGGHVAASCGTIWPAVDANAGDAETDDNGSDKDGLAKLSDTGDPAIALFAGIGAVLVAALVAAAVALRKMTRKN